MKSRGERITALTAYDFLMGELLDRASIDLILVGDSAAMVVQGRHTTVSVKMEQMLYHTRCVADAVKLTRLLVGLCTGALDHAEGADDGDGLFLPTNREIQDRALGLRAPVLVGGNLQRAKAVGFGAGLGHLVLR